MKKTVLILSFICIYSSALPQTYRNGFDKSDQATNEGQGYSLYSNAGLCCTYGPALGDNSTEIMESYLTMYRATRDKRYLDKLIIQIKRTQERRDDNIEIIGAGAVANSSLCWPSIYPTAIPDRPTRGWSYDGEWSHCDGNGWYAGITYDGRILFPMADFLYLMRVEFANNADLQSTPVPAEAAGTYLDTYSVIGKSVQFYSDFANWLEARVVQTIQYHECEWYADLPVIGSLFKGLYYESCSNSNNIEATNEQCAMGKSLALMYCVLNADGSSPTLLANYLSKVESIAYWFRAELTRETLSGDFLQGEVGYYRWCHNWTCNGYPEDIEHAMEEMRFADICYRNGIGGGQFFEDDMKRFGNTIAYIFYVRPLQFHLTVDGTDPGNGDCAICDGSAPSNHFAAIRHYGFMIPYNPYIYQIISDEFCSDAIYSNSMSWELSPLAYFQSPYADPNYQNRPIFNPIAVVRAGITVGNTWSACASGDFKGDGNIEFASSPGDLQFLQINNLDQDNNINSMAYTPTLARDYFAGLAAGKFGGSTYDRIAAIEKNSGTVDVYEESGSDIVQLASLEVFDSDHFTAICSGDFISSSPGDEILVYDKSRGQFFIYKYHDAGAYISLEATLFDGNSSNIFTSYQIAGITRGNFDGNNPNEIAMIDNSTGYINVYSVDATYHLNLLYQNQSTSGTNEWNGITAGDFDGDGIDEIIAHEDYDGQFMIFKIKNNALANLYSAYFPVAEQNGIMCSANFTNFPGSAALVTLRNYDGQITVFNMEGLCPGLNLSNQEIDVSSTPTAHTFTGVNNVDYHAQNLLTAENFTIDAPAEVTFVSGKEIDLLPGFEADNGCEFYAYIDEVNLNCGSQSTFRMAQHNSDGNDSSSVKDISKNNSSLSDIIVSPNPNTGTFHISMNVNDKISKSIFIYDAFGKEVYNNLENVQSDLDIDISNVAKGVYFVKVVGANGQQVAKVIVL